MAFHVGKVANRFLDLADRDGIAVSPMKLQKLVYLAHGWHWAIADAPLIDQVVEAWKFGPVVPSLYHEFKKFGSGSISGDRWREPVRDKTTRRWKLKVCEFQKGKGDPAVEVALAVIDRVWEVYKDYSAVELSNLTHEPNTPWRTAWDAMGSIKRKGKDIDEDEIRNHFKHLAESA